MKLVGINDVLRNVFGWCFYLLTGLERGVEVRVFDIDGHELAIG